LSDTPVIFDHVINIDIRQGDKFSRLDPDPDLEHSPQIPPRDLLNRFPRRNLGPQLPQNRQRTLKKIHIWIKLPPNPLEQEDRNDGIDKITLHSDMVCADIYEHLRQDVADFDLCERESLALYAQDEVLRLERKGLWVNDQFRRTAALDHQSAGPVAVKFGDGTEEIKEITPVRSVESCDEPSIDEDERRLETLFGESGESLEPSVGIVGEGAEARDDLIRYIGGCGMYGGLRMRVRARKTIGLGCNAEGGGQNALVKGFCGWFIEFNHYVAWMKIRMDEIIEQEHILMIEMFNKENYDYIRSVAKPKLTRNASRPRFARLLSNGPPPLRKKVLRGRAF
jgi:hypothetical protein